MIVCTVGTAGAQQEKRWPADLAVTGSRVAGAMFRTVNGGPLHTAFIILYCAIGTVSTKYEARTRKQLMNNKMLKKLDQYLSIKQDSLGTNTHINFSSE